MSVGLACYILASGCACMCSCNSTWGTHPGESAADLGFLTAMGLVGFLTLRYSPTGQVKPVSGS